MLTWIDYWLGVQWRNVQMIREEMGDKVFPSKIETPLEAAKFTIVTALEDPERTIRNAQYESWGRSTLMQAEIMMPFIFAPERTLSLQLTPELTQDFYGTKPPDDVDYDALLDKCGSVFIDIPPGIYRVVEGWSARAVILHRAAFGMGKPHMFIPVLREGKVDLDYQVECLFPFGLEMESTVVQTWHEDDPNAVPREADPTYYAEQVKDLIEDLAKLALLYYESSESEKALLPHVTVEDVLRTSNPKKRQARWTNASFFKISQLKSPKGRFGRTDQEPMPREGYNLQHRIPVRGHWRHQPHGPKRSLRRLQWIEGFQRGPKEAPLKPALHVLDSKE